MLSSVANKSFDAAIIHADRNIKSHHRCTRLNQVVHVFGDISLFGGSRQEHLDVLKETWLLLNIYLSSSSSLNLGSAKLPEVHLVVKLEVFGRKIS
jgi:hypothetical protein